MKYALLTIGAIALTGCTTVQRVAEEAGVLRPALVVVREGEPVPDVVPGQRLDIVMSTDGNPSARCAGMGGVLHWTTAQVEPTCMDVDF